MFISVLSLLIQNNQKNFKFTTETHPRRSISTVKNHRNNTLEK